jgi:hypothetical protein
MREPGRTTVVVVVDDEGVDPATTEARLRAASDGADGGVRTEVADVRGPPVVLVDAEGRCDAVLVGRAAGVALDVAVVVPLLVLVAGLRAPVVVVDDDAVAVRLGVSGAPAGRAEARRAAVPAAFLSSESDTDGRPTWPVAVLAAVAVAGLRAVVEGVRAGASLEARAPAADADGF